MTDVCRAEQIGPQRMWPIGKSGIPFAGAYTVLENVDRLAASTTNRSEP
jgi:hypothetical protein